MATRLGTRIRYWRELRGYSQQQVVNALGREGIQRERATLSQYETGLRTPGVEVINALCRVFRCKTEDLMLDTPGSLVDLPSDPATKADVDRILTAIDEVRSMLLGRTPTAPKVTA